MTSVAIDQESMMIEPTESQPQLRPCIGRLEGQVMEVLWSSGESSVRDVMLRLPVRPAYTTVMTIMVRLFRKGWLERQKVERRFFYRPKHTLDEWQRLFAVDALSRFLGTPHASRALLASALWETLSQHDPGLLLELDRQIQRKRRQEEYLHLSRRES
jgi:predicted transcriptional regulator